jgi:alkaline phosphatase D
MTSHWPTKNAAAKMLPMIGLLLLSVLAPAYASPLSTNIAYRSPSSTVKALEIDLGQIHAKARRLGKRMDDTYAGNVTFPYGVASGDPYANSVILWTMPRKLDLGGLYGGNAYPPICVKWLVSSSAEDFTNSSLVQQGLKLCRGTE